MVRVGAYAPTTLFYGLSIEDTAMIPVFQTLTVSNNGRGNCFNACLASLLELPLREVADILPENEGDWYEQWNVWLAGKGYKLEDYVPDDEDDDDEPPRGYSIACVFTDRIYPSDHERAGEKIPHAVVMFDGTLVHDPYPLDNEVMELNYYQLLVPLNEAEQRIHAIKAEYGLCPHGYKVDCETCEKGE